MVKNGWQARFAYVFVAACMAILLIGCGPKHQQEEAPGLEGTYGVLRDGKVVPVVEVTKNGDGYLVKMMIEGRTGPQLASKPLPKDRFEKAFHVTVQGSYEGIQANEAVVVKLEPGFVLGDVRSTSGYFMIALAPMALLKMS